MPLRTWIPALATIASLATPAAAWLPESRLAIADWAARIAPPDLGGQIELRAASFRAGVLAPIDTSGDGGLAARVARESRRAIGMIEEHRPLDDVIYQLGVVSQLVAAAANPLDASDDDPQEPRYHQDFLRYAHSTEGRLKPVFYGVPAGGASADTALETLISTTLERSRRLYPAVGREYRRVAFADGRRVFDDRSTAFGVVSVAYSRAITDVAVVLRYIWLRSGGGDNRSDLPVRGR